MRISSYRAGAVCRLRPSVVTLFDPCRTFREQCRIALPAFVYGNFICIWRCGLVAEAARRWHADRGSRVLCSTIWGVSGQ